MPSHGSDWKTQMRILLTGVSCVGKTTIGTQLAELRGVPFFDLDREVERFYAKPIGRLQAECLTMESYRKKASKVLGNLLSEEQTQACVIALAPSGLMGSYWKVVKSASGVTIVLTDTPENIVERLVFYDDDSRPLEKVLRGPNKTVRRGSPDPAETADRRSPNAVLLGPLSASDRQAYVKEIKKDMAYFRRSYKRADLSVDIAGLSPPAKQLSESTQPCQPFSAPKSVPQMIPNHPSWVFSVFAGCSSRHLLFCCHQLRLRDH